MVAPLFWYVLLGLPGLVAFKMVSTLDSMIGYRHGWYRYMGLFSARMDDCACYVPSRLSAFVIALGSWRGFWLSLGAAWRDGHRHASLNAGWPEAAAGGALGIALGGARVYGGVVVDDPWIGGEREATLRDGWEALRLYHRASVVLVGMMVLWLLHFGLVDHAIMG